MRLVFAKRIQGVKVHEHSADAMHQRFAVASNQAVRSRSASGDKISDFIAVQWFFKVIMYSPFGLTISL